MPHSLIHGVLGNDHGSISRAITLIENHQTPPEPFLSEIHANASDAIRIGITGPPGAGKSTLTNALIETYLANNKTVGVVAVDPTSPFTGGALLGDRVRMTESTDSGTYIRSIASRGATGAVSRSIRNSIRVLEYAGFNPIIIESVGAGQTEVEISNIADIIIVVFNPHTGDSIQTIKAGITEIGDMYIVNKSDLDGAGQLFQAVQDFIGSVEKNPIILKVSSKTGKGITEFVKELRSSMKKKKKNKKQKENEMLAIELNDIILNTINQKISSMVTSSKSYSTYLKKVQGKKIDPFEASDKISKELLRK